MTSKASLPYTDAERGLHRLLVLHRLAEIPQKGLVPDWVRDAAWRALLDQADFRDRTVMEMLLGRLSDATFERLVAACAVGIQSVSEVVLTENMATGTVPHVWEPANGSLLVGRPWRSLSAAERKDVARIGWPGGEDLTRAADGGWTRGIHGVNRHVWHDDSPDLEDCLVLSVVRPPVPAPPAVSCSPVSGLRRVRVRVRAIEYPSDGWPLPPIEQLSDRPQRDLGEFDAWQCTALDTIYIDPEEHPTFGLRAGERPYVAEVPPAETTPVPRDTAAAERDALVKTLADLFGWTDTTYDHALLNVGEAVTNLRLDLLMAQRVLGTTRQAWEALRVLAQAVQELGAPWRRVIVDRDERDSALVKAVQKALRLADGLLGTRRDSDGPAISDLPPAPRPGNRMLLRTGRGETLDLVDDGYRYLVRYHDGPAVNVPRDEWFDWGDSKAFNYPGIDEAFRDMLWRGLLALGGQEVPDTSAQHPSENPCP